MSWLLRVLLLGNEVEFGGSGLPLVELMKDNEFLWFAFFSLSPVQLDPLSDLGLH